MKLVRFALASMVVIGAAAAPLRVVVIGGGQDLSQNMRFGHAVPNTLLDAMPAGHNGARKDNAGRPCMMRKMAMKAVAVSNAFRKAVGFPLIEDPNLTGNKANNHGSEPVYSILPFIGTPPSFVNVKGPGEGGITAFTKGGDRVRIVGPDGTILIKEDPGHHPHRHHHKHHKHCHSSPFLYRLNFALLSLGKWEGRAVAFVLGCGLGVLLRMFWVLSVITFRAIKGTRMEEVEYTIIHEYVNEAPAPPPSYPVDEKAEAKKDDQVASA